MTTVETIEAVLGAENLNILSKDELSAAETLLKAGQVPAAVAAIAATTTKSSTTKATTTT